MLLLYAGFCNEVLEWKIIQCVIQATFLKINQFETLGNTFSIIMQARALNSDDFFQLSFNNSKQ